MQRAQRSAWFVAADLNTFNKMSGTAPDSKFRSYQERIRQALLELGIPESFATERRQSLHLECDDLVSIGLDNMGREQRMERRAAAQWQEMLAAASGEGVVLEVISAFRS